jgi:hypothetical protein
VSLLALVLGQRRQTQGVGLTEEVRGGHVLVVSLKYKNFLLANLLLDISQLEILVEGRFLPCLGCNGRLAEIILILKFDERVLFTYSIRVLERH